MSSIPKEMSAQTRYREVSVRSNNARRNAPARANVERRGQGTEVNMGKAQTRHIWSLAGGRLVLGLEVHST